MRCSNRNVVTSAGALARLERAPAPRTSRAQCGRGRAASASTNYARWLSGGKHFASMTTVMSSASRGARLEPRPDRRRGRCRARSRSRRPSTPTSSSMRRRRTREQPPERQLVVAAMGLDLELHARRFALERRFPGGRIRPNGGDRSVNGGSSDGVAQPDVRLDVHADAVVHLERREHPRHDVRSVVREAASRVHSSQSATGASISIDSRRGLRRSSRRRARARGSTGRSAAVFAAPGDVLARSGSAGSAP